LANCSAASARSSADLGHGWAAIYANGSPIGDLPPALIALGATLELRRGRARSRQMPLEAFFIAYRRQDRKPGEFVRRVIVPRLRPGEAFRAFKVTKRLDEDISAVMGAFKLTLDEAPDHRGAHRLWWHGWHAHSAR